MAAEPNTILIRYGELFLKGNNRYYFESLLIKNIKAALFGIRFKFVKSQSRFFVEDFDPADKNLILSRLTKVFGIHSLSPAVKIRTDLKKIGEIASMMAPEQGTFRVTVRRADKKIPKKSMEIAAEIGGDMLERVPARKVDLFRYDFELCVDIREDGWSYVFYEVIPGAQGLPSGCSGRAMLLLSGGIDSPVAAYKMGRRGVTVCCVHFHSFPYTSELALRKVVDLTEMLRPYVPFIELTVVPFTKIQYAIHEHCPQEFMITIMRRFMMRIAERLAQDKKCGALITGESLGQVASQTMESINATNSVVKMPVFRPLIGNDKEEIIEIAKKIGTFDISIRPYEDCCTVFLPKNPVIHPKLSEVERYESKLDIEPLIAEAIAGAEVRSAAFPAE
jgi:thiamine biosynthesis protein ThiI